MIKVGIDAFETEKKNKARHLLFTINNTIHEKKKQ